MTPDLVSTIHPLAASLDPNQVSPGLLGFIIVVIIGLITWFLARSMAKHLRKLDVGHRAAEEAAEAAAAEEAGEGGKSKSDDEVDQVSDKPERSPSGNPATNGAR
jgi:flagellar biosynthesis/type III secretory pathway M-ring protein FliF/YscJ